MNTKKRILSIILLFAILAGLVSKQTQKTVSADTVQTFSIEDAKFYNELKYRIGLYNQDAIQASDDTNQTITLDMSKVKKIHLSSNGDISVPNSAEIFQTLLKNCTNLEYLYVYRCHLTNVDLSLLDHRDSLTKLYLADCYLTKVPDFTLPNLKELSLTENDLSADGALDSLNKAHFPALKTLLMDDCEISNVQFLKNLGELKNLTIGDNGLSDDDIPALLEMSAAGGNLSGLEMLNLGKTTYTTLSNYGMTGGNNKNVFTDTKSLVSFLTSLKSLQEVNLMRSNLTSLQAFTGISKNVRIDFQENGIVDFAGLESNTKLILTEQNISLFNDYKAGNEYELPNIMKRLLDANDVLYSTEPLVYHDCSISEDRQKLIIASKATNPYVEVKSGRLYDSKISFVIKRNPTYTVPKNLTAVVGDTLAQVALPEGFSWQDPALDVGEEGTHNFQAIYTPSDTNRYHIISGINIPVTVMKYIPTPSPEPTMAAKPTETPDPAETFVPTEQPTETPEPSETFTPTATPEPTETLAPTPSKEPEKTSEQIALEKKKRKKRELSFNAKLKVKYVGRKIKIEWGKIADADRYDVYVQSCSKKFTEKSAIPIENGKTTKLTVTKVNGQKLDLTHIYKVYVSAYKVTDGKKVTLAKTITAHVVGKKNKTYTNVKEIKLKKNTYTLKKGKTATIKANTVLVNKHKKDLTNEHARKFRYATTNQKIAAVSNKGKIKAVGKGSCSIYVYARNGYAKKLKVRVK